jgi:hypothetical protein
MKTLKAKFAAGAAALSMAGGAMGLLATTASASTTGCVNAPSTSKLYQSCGDEENTYSNGFDVYKQSAAANTKIIAFADSSTDPATDFYAFQSTSNPDERVFEYAPNGKLSGLVISDPMGGVKGDSRDGLVLRPYNNSAFQQFTGVDTQDTAGTQWTNVASKQVVQPNGTGSQLTTVKDVTNAAGSYWGWNQPGVVPGG